MDQIMEYLRVEKKIPEKLALKHWDNLCRYEDIRTEFLYWLEQRSYLPPDPIVIEGYRAVDIHTLAPFLEGLGVYNFMVTLREKPDTAALYIKNRFPRR